MARRDAQLVISAKDRASKIVDQITSAINDLVGGNEELQASAKATDSTLGKLGGAIKKLDKAVDALSFGDRITGELANADAAIDRLNGGINRTQNELAEMRAGVDQASGSLTNLTGRIERAQAALDRQSATVAEAGAEARKLATAQEAAAKAQADFTKRAQELPAAIEAQAAKVAKAEARYEGLQAKLAETVKPTQRLKDQVTSAGNAFEAQRTKLAGLTDEYGQIGPKVESASQALVELSAASAKAAASVERQEQSIARTKGLIAGLAAEQKKAARTQRDLTDEISRAEGSLKSQVEDLDAARAAYVQLQAAMEATEAQQARMKAAALGSLEKQLDEQGRAAQEARAHFAALSAEADRLAAEIGKVGVPTREMSKSLALAGQAADEAHLKLMLQEDTLDELGRAYRTGAQDVASLQKSQASFIATQARMSAAMGELAADGFRARQAIRGLHQEVDKSAQSWGEIDRAARGAARGMKASADSADEVTRAYRRMHGAKRESLSLMQRIRGEVLSMVAAYGGLYGVVSVLQQTAAATQTLEAAQARLNVATEGNSGQTADELDFVRRNANRLGIEFGVLANEYSKFSLATQGTNLAGQRTRDIFVAVAEAARVSRTSNDDLAATFVALSQIASKGSVQMEELRQQLGDRLPGAINLMADALGIGTGELIKMMEQGQITSDALLPFAEELRERFGPELGNALAGTSVALGRLQNAAFQALVSFGEGGFIQGLTDLSNTLAKMLGSSDFQAFAQNVSAALQTVMGVLEVMAENFQAVAIAGGALFGLMAIRWAPAVIRLAGNVTGLTAALTAVKAGAAAANASLASTSVAATTATGRVRALTIALRAFLASTGVGLAIAAVGAGLAYWVTEADNATEALDRHTAILDEVRNAYDLVNGSVEQWREKIEQIGEQEAVNNLTRMEQAVADLSAELDRAAEGNDSFLTNFFGYNLGGQGIKEIFDVPAGTRQAVADVAEAFADGKIEGEEFYSTINEALRAVDDGSEEFQQYSDNVLDVSKALLTAKLGARQAELIITAMTGSAEEAAAALEELANRGEESAEGIEPIRESADDAAEASEKLAKAQELFTESVRGMLADIPELEGYLEELERQEAFDKLMNDAIGAAVEIANVQQAWTEMKAQFQGDTFQGLFTSLFTDLDGLIGKFTAAGGAAGGMFSRVAAGLQAATGGMGEALSLIGGPDSRLLQLIDQTEGGGNYGTLYGNSQRPGQRYAGTDITQMTLAELDAFGKSGYGDWVQANNPRGNWATPAGRYQIVGDTRERAARGLGLDMATTRFTPEVQDMMAAYLIAERLASSNTMEGKMEALREEWEGFANVSDANLEAAIVEFESRDSTEQAREQVDFNEEQGANSADRSFELEQGLLVRDGLEKEAEIREAIRTAELDAAERGVALTDEQIARIREETGALYDQAEAQKLLDEQKAAQATIDETISDAEFELQQQELKNQGLERQAAIEAELRAASKTAQEAGLALTEEEIAALSRLAGARYDAERAGRGESDELDRAEAAQKVVNDLLDRRNELEAQYQALLDRGDTTGANAAKDDIAELNTELLSAIDNAKAMWEAVGNSPEAATALATLETARIEADGFDESAKRNYLDWKSLSDLFVTGVAGAVDNIAQKWAETDDKIGLVRDSFLQFAADFLLRIAQMIIQQAIFNALKGAFGGSAFGTAIGLPVGTGHTGGMVGSQRIGSGNPTRTLNPAVFATAARFHEGGFPGLMPNEIPAVLKKGEYVADEDDPFHPSNRQTTVSAPDVKQKIVNVLDGTAMLEAALKTGVGEKLILNYIRDNADALGLSG